jgi:hypothetical protein
MKRLWLPVVWFCAGAVLGEIASTLLFRSWSDIAHPALKSMYDWLASLGHQSLANAWVWFWLNLPTWFSAAVVGFMAGIAIKRNHVLNLLLVGLGFAVVPLALAVYLYSFAPYFTEYVWHLATFVLLFLFGLLGHRIRKVMLPNTTLELTTSDA